MHTLYTHTPISVYTNYPYIHTLIYICSYPYPYIHTDMYIHIPYTHPPIPLYAYMYIHIPYYTHLRVVIQPQ